MPHYVTQRGNRRQATFFCDHDYQAYLDLMAEWCGEHNPVRARLATAPSEYRWSSACAHIKRKDDCPGEGCAAVGAGEELATTPEQRGNRR